MSYRFSNTDKWNDSWYFNLKPLEKLLFIYLCDNCDIAGFIEFNLKKWASDIGVKPIHIEGACKGLARGLLISKNNDCFYIRNFLKHQKNLPLNENNKAHKGIIKRFEYYSQKFDIQDINIFIEGACKGLPSPTGIGIGNDIGNGKEEKIEKKLKKFIPPTLEEVQQYFFDNGYSKEIAKKAFMSYNVAQWHDSKGSQILNWKQKMINVWFKEENKINNMKLLYGKLHDNTPTNKPIFEP